MSRIYAPWRSEYLMSDKKPDGECLFCAFARSADDDENLVLERGDHWYVVINKYPYTTGHVMVVCNRHVEGFTALDAGERDELGDMMARVESALREAYGPDGMNVGANLGRNAGAGIVGHLHIHLVPRWQGDTNFMSSVGETRVISEDLLDTFTRVSAALEKAK